MTLSRKLPVLAGLLLAAASAHAQVFTVGDLVLSVYGADTNGSDASDTGAFSAFANGATTTSAAVSTASDGAILTSAQTASDSIVTAISLVEISTSAGVNSTPVTSLILPTSVSGSNVGIVGEYGSSSEGNIQLSGNGQYLTMGGYSAAPAIAGTGNPSGAEPYGLQNGGTGLAQSPSQSVPRVAALIDANGNVNTGTTLSGVYTTDNPRSVYSPDGTMLLISGQGNKNGTGGAAGSNDSGDIDEGVFSTTVGSTVTAITGTASAYPTLTLASGTTFTSTSTYNNGSTAVPVYNTNDTRFVTQYAGNTYVSMDKGNSKDTRPAGVYLMSSSSVVGSTQTTTTTTMTQITAGNNGKTGSAEVFYSPEGFWFANANTLYVADTGVSKTGGTGAGGIQKWMNLGGNTWTLVYQFVNPGNFLTPAQAVTAAATATPLASGSTATPGVAGTGGETGFEAITGQVNGNGTVSLYAVSYTAGDAVVNGLYTVNDTLGATTAGADAESGQVTELESSLALSNSATIKGVAFAPTLSAVPEPSAYGLMGAAALGVAAAIRRRRRKAL